MTLGAADNLAALRARSPEIPLYDTAEVVGRRLADRLRETGLDAAIVDVAHGPLTGRGQETWPGVPSGWFEYLFEPIGGETMVVEPSSSGAGGHG
jgi:type VII secretion protein EccE